MADLSQISSGHDGMSFSAGQGTKDACRVAGAIKTKMSRIRPSKWLDDFIPSGSLRTGGANDF